MARYSHDKWNKIRCNVSYESIFYSRIFNCVENGSKYKRGWIRLFVKDGIITFSLDRYFLPVGFEAFCSQLNLRRKKWPIFYIYKPHNRFIKHHLKELGKAIEFYSKTYENIIVMGDFNTEISEHDLASFFTFYNFKSLINKPTCYKIPDNSSWIDLILTNCFIYFQNSSTFETGLSDFHKLILTLFKSKIPEPQPNMMPYRNYKRFDRETLETVISKKIEENTSWILELLNVPSSLH